ncbi:hypothetical protein CEUSTIGMA_g13255.t1 [Chlamydomonas eustigma]|uniref:Enolpyruvate transferase domain-containing protein n=1 Tax=Chlamydomonas eustigma TaxID=1157962 RepID=A0A250XSQ7_9CHLO|nr:hypothetical protein CEUSTIGMA_g13255.t1 [Chlamydomonas eustigma]|eukprot:GAX85840.1 hypothetical protein CEUSTIGMA_g13255.t1 [Chlamydomonas eustigma]
MLQKFKNHAGSVSRRSPGRSFTSPMSSKLLKNKISNNLETEIQISIRALVMRAAAAHSSLEQLTIQPVKEVSGHVKLPGSKSLSNRILLIAALSEGTTLVKNLLDSDDIRYMVEALKALGIKLEEKWDQGEMLVHGCGGKFPVEGAELNLGNAGTAMRPLTAAVAAAGRGK